jgi:hypothetical protein
MALDYFKAKEAGYSDEEIAAYYAQEKGVDYTKAVEAGYKPIEIIGGLGYNMDLDKVQGTSETILRQLERGVSGTYRFGKQLFGTDMIPEQPEDGFLPRGLPQTPDKVEAAKTTDKEKELEARIQLETNPLTAYPSRIVGGIADPGTWLPVGKITSAATGAKQFAVQGAIGGALEPVYGDDSRLLNVATGTALGVPIGAAVGKVISKFGKSAGQQADEAVDIPAPSTKGVDDALNEPITPPKQAADETLATPPKVEEPAPVTAPVAQAVPDDLTPPSLATPGYFPDPYQATLPTGLSKAAPRYGRDVVGFNSDLDRALYIVRDGANRSKADAAYMAWVKKVTGIDDDATIRSLGNDVKRHLEASGDIGNVPPSNLNIGSLRGAVDASGLPSVVPDIAKPTAPYLGSPEAKLGDGFNPQSKAWNSLDNSSQNLYNIGRRFLESDQTGLKPRLSTIEQVEAVKAVRTIDPNFKEAEMPNLFRSYSKAMDDLYGIKGDDFVPPSLEKLLKQGIDDADMMELMNKGVFDGCTL